MVIFMGAAIFLNVDILEILIDILFIIFLFCYLIFYKIMFFVKINLIVFAY